MSHVSWMCDNVTMLLSKAHVSPLYLVTTSDPKSQARLSHNNTEADTKGYKGEKVRFGK